jgi:phosphatidylserine/phosphatidylglycerophosphate/cardiolipin synthase-like enzyme
MFKRVCLFVGALLLLCVPLHAAEPFPAGASFVVGFSPEGEAEAVILRGIAQAQKSIRVAASSFTSRPISRALVDAHKRGIDVRVIADKEWNRDNAYSAINFLANQGVPVRVNGNYAIFHHKFMILDGRHVQTGSFNYSAAAARRNAENVLLLLDVPQMAEQYDREWQRQWAVSTEVKARY